MITVRLHGRLGKKFRGDQPDGSWLLNVQTPREAVHAIEANVGGIFKYLVRCTQKGIEYRVVIDNQDFIHLDQLYIPMGEYETIDIIPVVIGESSLSIWQIVAGVLLVVVGIIAPYIIPAAWTIGGVALGVTLGTSLVTLGIGLVLSGLANLIFSPDAASPSKGKNKPSYLFNGPVNSTRQGEAVPVLYGRVLVGSQRVSAYVTTVKINNRGQTISDIPTDANPPSAASNPSGGPFDTTSNGGLVNSGRIILIDDADANDPDFAPAPTVTQPGLYTNQIQ